MYFEDRKVVEYLKKHGKYEVSHDDNDRFRSSRVEGSYDGMIHGRLYLKLILKSTVSNLPQLPRVLALWCDLPCLRSLSRGVKEVRVKIKTFERWKSGEE